MPDTPVQQRQASAGRFELAVGVVVQSLPFTACVLVEVPGRRARPALVGSSMGHPGHGGRETAGILPGARVACLLSLDSDTEAYVIAALPDPVSNPDKAPLEYMQQAGGSTTYTERMLYDILFHKNQPLTFAHAGTPVDLQPGEWSLLNDLGGGLGLERFAAWLRASEFCSVTADSLTDTLRIMARTVVTQTVTRADLDTIIGKDPLRISTRAMFESEAYGLKKGATSAAFKPGAGSPVGVSPSSGIAAALDVVRDPEDPGKEIRLAPRVIEVEGGTAGGAHRHTVSPVFKGDQHFGGVTPLLREFRGIDGVYHVASNRGIHIWKTAEVPDVVAETAEPADAAAPLTPYRSDPFTLDDNLFTAVGSGALAYEYHAFLMNTGSASTSRGVDTVAPLPKTDEQWLPIQTSTELVITPGAAPVKFYSVSAGISIMPDGYVVITDGWGSQIVMGGGNVVITAPGDIYRLPGRNDVVLAPGDAIIRAKHDVDMSSSQGSVRVKAEINLSFLGGNAGYGGVLIESKGAGKIDTTPGAKAVHSGIAMKSAGDIVQIATGGIQRNATQLADFAATETSEIGSVDLRTPNMLIGAEGKQYLFGEGMMLIPTDIIAQGNMHLKGRSRFGGWVYIESEGIFSREAIVTKKAVVTAGLSEAPSDKIEDPFDRKNKLPGETDTNPSTIRDVINAREAKALESVKTFDTKAWKAYDDGIGKRYDGLAALAFSFRFDMEYLGRKIGQGFILPAAAWQQRLDAVGAGRGWREPAVTPGGDVQASAAPYPGLEAWTGAGVDAEKHGLYLLWQPRYHDPATQRVQPGTAAADEPAPPIEYACKVFTEYITPTT